VATCWNEARLLCYDCAPNVQTELAAALAQTTVEQLRQKVQEQDLTKGMDWTTPTTALCPSCGAHTQGSKFYGVRQADARRGRLREVRGGVRAGHEVLPRVRE
jgi:hypothetical protein